MSRSGYTDDCDDERQRIMWRGAVVSSIRGKRGQAFLRELLATLDAMPDKKLIAHDLRKAGEVCAIGSVGAVRGVDMEALDPDDYRRVAEAFGIAAPLVQEIEWINDEASYGVDSPQSRWHRVRAWVASKIKPDPAP